MMLTTCCINEKGRELTTTCKHSIAVLGKFVKSESKSFAILDCHLKSVKFWLAHSHTDAVKIVQGKLAAVSVVLQANTRSV